MVIFDLADGRRAAVRPSGTEPKIKFYLFARRDPKGAKFSASELAKTKKDTAAEDCTASFRVTTPVDKPETCKRLLDQAEETAKPFMAGPKYKMPTECG